MPTQDRRSGNRAAASFMLQLLTFTHMGKFLDSIPFSGIIRIRDMMYSVTDPFRLDQGDVSFDAPDTVKAAMHRAIDDNRSHYLQTTGLPRLLELLAGKLRTTNGIPVESTDDVMVTTGGIHGVFIACQGLLEPGEDVVQAGMCDLGLAVGVVCQGMQAAGERRCDDEHRRSGVTGILGFRDFGN